MFFFLTLFISMIRSDHKERGYQGYPKVKDIWKRKQQY